MVRAIATAIALSLGLAGGAVAAHKPPVLVFSSAPSPARDAAKAMMEKEAGLIIDDKSMEVAQIDIDADGTPELFAFAINTDYFCGDAGCVPRLYRKNGEGWQQVDFGLNDFINGSPDDWSIASKPKSGHLVFVLQIHRPLRLGRQRLRRGVTGLDRRSPSASRAQNRCEHIG